MYKRQVVRQHLAGIHAAHQVSSQETAQHKQHQRKRSVETCDLFWGHGLAVAVYHLYQTQVLVFSKVNFEIHEIAPKRSLCAHIGKLCQHAERQVAVFAQQAMCIRDRGSYTLSNFIT